MDITSDIRWELLSQISINSTISSLLTLLTVKHRDCLPWRLGLGRGSEQGGSGGALNASSFAAGGSRVGAGGGAWPARWGRRGESGQTDRSGSLTLQWSASVTEVNSFFCCQIVKAILLAVTTPRQHVSNIWDVILVIQYNFYIL